MNNHWELWDVYKALMAIGAGVLLGFEREMKDKVAGLKTITIITVGSALFAILSYKVGAGYDTTRIASYVVSGVGFIGAGAIFRDGFSITGLTTAGLIWLAAAIGLAIGFGEIYLAATFIACWMFMLVVAPLINMLYRSKKMTRQLQVEFSTENFSKKDSLLRSFKENGVAADEKKLNLKDNNIIISIEVVVTQPQMNWLQQYLLEQKWITSFDI